MDRAIVLFVISSRQNKQCLFISFHFMTWPTLSQAKIQINVELLRRILVKGSFVSFYLVPKLSTTNLFLSATKNLPGTKNLDFL